MKTGSEETGQHKTKNGIFFRKQWKWLLTVVVIPIAVATINSVYSSRPNVNSVAKTSHIGSESQDQNSTGQTTTPLQINNPEGETISNTKFESDFSSNFNWVLGRGMKKTGNIIQYRGSGPPALLMTKEKFNQSSTIKLSFITHSIACNLSLRVENAFDLRVCDGGNTEVGLWGYSDDPNWVPIPLSNPNSERDIRFVLPCPIPLNAEVSLRAVVDAPPDYSHRKTVTLFYDYYCENGTHINPEDTKFNPPSWTFTVPERVNRPASFGVGLNDPNGHNRPKVELIHYSVEQ